MNELGSSPVLGCVGKLILGYPSDSFFSKTSSQGLSLQAETYPKILKDKSGYPGILSQGPGISRDIPTDTIGTGFQMPGTQAASETCQCATCPWHDVLLQQGPGLILHAA